MPMQEKDSGQVVIAARRTQRGFSYWGLLLLIVLSSVVSFTLCEIGLRLFWHNPYRYELPEHILRFRLAAARTDHVLDRSAIDPERPMVRYRTDERSYLLPSRRFEMPDATIAFLGGSTTECTAVHEELRFPARVSYLLEKKGLQVNTLNAGQAMGTVHDAINVLFNHIIEDKPDAVVLMEATNDIGYLQRQSYRQQMGQAESFYDAIHFGLQKASTTSYFMGVFRKWASPSTGKQYRPNANPWHREKRETAQIPRDEYETRLRAFVRLSRAFGIEPVLMTQPLANIRNALTPDWVDPRNQDVFNHLIRTVGAEEGAVVIDLVRHLVENIEGWDQHMNIFYDGVHVTDRGSEVYAEYIAKRLYDEGLARRFNRAARKPTPETHLSNYR
jgi:lysophospholipase L1-like esterase